MDKFILLIIEILNDKEVNPYYGSISIEKLIISIKNKNMQFYIKFVQCDKKKFITMLKDHPDFIIFYSKIHRNEHRIILRSNKLWYIRDLQNIHNNEYKREQIKVLLYEELYRNNGYIYIDEFLQLITMKKGDFLRTIIYTSSDIYYNKKNQSLSFDAACYPV